MKQAWRKIDRYSHEIRLIAKANFNTLDDVEVFINTSSEQIKIIEEDRQHIYNKLRRCTDTNKRTEQLSKRDICSVALKALRKDIRTAKHIIKDNSEIKSNIKAEQNLQQQRYIVKNKQKTKEMHCCR